MALLKCVECGAAVSDRAKACPSCGNPVPPPKKKTTPVARIAAALIIPGCAGGVWLANQAESDRARLESMKSPETRAAEQAQGALDQRRIMLARLAKASILKAARDPDSVVFESVSVTQDAHAACVEYRARNGFNGMARGFYVLTATGAFSDNPTAWNKNCTKNTFDYTQAPPA